MNTCSVSIVTFVITSFNVGSQTMQMFVCFSSFFLIFITQFLFLELKFKSYSLKAAFQHWIFLCAVFFLLS